MSSMRSHLTMKTVLSVGVLSAGVLFVGVLAFSRLYPRQEKAVRRVSFIQETPSGSCREVLCV